jgi:hypothetical protein
LAALNKNVRGREISDDQWDRVVNEFKGKPLPDLVTYIVGDPEARMYGLSIAGLLQDIGMSGKISFVEGVPPAQTGVVFCGDGTEVWRHFMDVMMKEHIVTVGNPHGKWGHDKNGNEIVASYCPPGSIFVGLRPPLSLMRPGVRQFKPADDPK